MNALLGLVARYIRPIESAAFSYLGLTVANGSGVVATSASTSAALAGVIAACHLVVEIFNEVRKGNYSLVKSQAQTVVADVKAAAEVLAEASKPTPPPAA